jgi:hypothetical protein
MFLIPWFGIYGIPFVHRSSVQYCRKDNSEEV